MENKEPTQINKEHLFKFFNYLSDEKQMFDYQIQPSVMYDVIDGFIEHIEKLESRQYSDNIIKAVQHVNKLFAGRVIFCGSLGLSINNLLNRNVEDIDVLSLDDHYHDKFDDRIEGGSGRFKIEGVDVKAFKLEMSGINIDVMHHINVNKTKYTTVLFHGEEIKVELPMGAYKAKKSYIESNQLKNRKKHIQDLEYIKKQWEL